ncbi:MAG: hypothetical protein AUG85_05350 [Gemmatimonadetes bacterium 13_1_20CM_4_66_11]|nr:MAG: hypothetical protein AUI86_11830 [Gemmatimonadetes bacterium 13_1_40CM_3_66_12]OLD88128.1 MAG: hypothetical protein AUG85_05350 [Gemmatimonadetes bacterium 13_1_20CM_4_66_11]
MTIPALVYCEFCDEDVAATTMEPMTVGTNPTLAANSKALMMQLWGHITTCQVRKKGTPIVIVITEADDEDTEVLERMGGADRD